MGEKFKDEVRRFKNTVKDEFEKHVNSETVKKTLKQTADITSNVFDNIKNKSKELTNKMKFIDILENSKKFMKHSKYNFRFKVTDNNLMRLSIYDKITGKYIASLDATDHVCEQVMLIIYAINYNDSDFSKFSENIGDSDPEEKMLSININKK